MHIVCVAAARPNFMKIKPVMDGLRHRDIRTTLVHTGQHYDTAMSDVFFDELGLQDPDHHLGAGSGSHAEQTAKVMVGFEHLLGTLDATTVVVVGDVNSTVACALVGAKSGLAVAHVEAGLRSRDWSMPEEVNRVVADRVSDFLYAPSADAVANLEGEGYRPDQIHLVGNVMIDTLLSNRTRAEDREVWKRFGVKPGQYGVITMHRPANVDESHVLGRIVGALEEIGRDLPLLFPVHPRTRSVLERVISAGSPIRLCEPLGYLDFLGLTSSARLVLTDSGGVQEETTVLGIPCLTLRDNTERPITITEGTNQLVGRDPSAIIAAAERALRGDVVPRRPDLWDGQAGERIAAHLASTDVAALRRPTEL